MKTAMGFWSWLAVAILLCCCTGGGLFAANGVQIGSDEHPVEITGFRARGQGAINTITMMAPKSQNDSSSGDSRWEIRGRRALRGASNTQIYDFVMTVNSSQFGEYRFVSPLCRIDHADREVHSNQALLLEGRDMQVAGNGYDLYWDEEKKSICVVIREAVHIVINRAVAKEVKHNHHRATPDSK